MIESRERVLLLLIAIVLGIIILQNPPVIETERIVTKIDRSSCDPVVCECKSEINSANNKETIPAATEPWVVQARVDKAIERLTKFITVPEAEKEPLLKTLSTLAEQGAIKREDLIAALPPVLASSFKDKLSEIEKFTENEERDKKLYYLTRTLNLTTEQERMLADVFVQVEKIIQTERERVFNLQRDLMAKHGSGGMQSMAEKFAAMEDLIASVDQMEKSLLREKTEKILSIEQFAKFNDWLERPRESWVW